ncbi:MAG: hypothetical protein LKF37_13915 [Lentilactobacillus diolivorans]|jgi:hypothetical protein|nr:hypothetical protein [Lentilactobacillus diolivorans]RRG02316.1 MAG: hypothetical protein DUD34_09310 [Lactobacillus sp.]
MFRPWSSSQLACLGFSFFVIGGGRLFLFYNEMTNFARTLCTILIICSIVLLTVSLKKYHNKKNQ